jgi:hypothetical protein
VSPRARLFTLAFALAACGDAESNKTTQAWNPDTDDGASSSASGGNAQSSASASAATSATASATGGGSCDEACESPPGECYLAPGNCIDDGCVYDPALAGTPCLGDCKGGGHCDAAGMCICGAPDDCASTCLPGPNMDAACDEAGMCIRSCQAPYDDCDGDPSNGCEVPVGVPHQCDLSGLNPDGGCWTAYCGSAAGDGVFDFGTYHCVDCSTCGTTDGGQCHWCNHDTGNWFPAEACECGTYLDAVCGPV